MPADVLIRDDAIAADRLVDGAAVRGVVALAWPAAIHAGLTALGFVFDRIWVGRLDTAALASLHVSSTLSWTLLVTLGGIAVGTLAAVGRAIGDGRPRDARAIGEVALVASLVASGSLALLLTLARGALVDALCPATSEAANEAVRSHALAYLAVALPCLPLGVLSMTAAACLQARGDTRTPRVAAVAARSLHVALGTLLVLRLNVGVAGAAWAAAASFAVELAWLLVALRRRHRGVASVRWRAKLRLLTGLSRLSLPAMADKGLHQLGFLAYAAVVARLGADAMANNQRLLSVEALAFPVVEGLAVAAAVSVARASGSKHAREGSSVDAAWRAASTIAAISMVVFALAWLTAPSWWLGIVSSTTAPVAGHPGHSDLEAGLFVAAISQPFMAVAVVGANALRGAGRTRQVMWMTLCCSLPLRLSLCWLFAIELNMGLSGAWLGCGFDWMLQALWVTLLRRTCNRSTETTCGFPRR